MTIKKTNFAARTLCMACAAICVMLAALPAAAENRLFHDASYTQHADPILLLTLGKAEIITLPDTISDIFVANPKIADVIALQNNKLYVVGSKLGDTNIIVTDRSGNVLRRLNISVNVDTVVIENMIHSMFPSEKTVKVNMIGDQVALTGMVSTPSAAQKVARLVAAHMGEIQEKDFKRADDLIVNLMEVRGEQQVMLRVRMLEMSRGVLKELGLGSNINRGDGRSINDGGLTGFLGTIAGTGLTTDPLGVASAILDTGISGIGNIEFLINALQSDNLVNILAEPNLTSVSGEQAGFLAGGEFPVPVGRDRDGNIIVEYKEFGVSLNFKPTVLSEDRISLQMNTEVSSLNRQRGLTLAEIQIPGLDVRRASTTVEINSGGTLMMAGLLKSESVKGMSGIPGIKDTPVIGDLLSSDSFNRQETELVVLVTPYLVQPFADKNQSVPMIDETELGEPMPPPPPAGLMVPPKEKLLPSQKSEVKTAPKQLLKEEKHSALPPGFTEGTVEQESVLVEKVPARKAMSPDSPLTRAFSRNMQGVYGDKLGDISKEKQSYGYMLE
jgi:pilus assembly protein CpaC